MSAAVREANAWPALMPRFVLRLIATAAISVAALDTTADNLIWLGAISDGELAALLADCLCLAFPSLAEGFGLPPLEAMALGCPVVVSDQASLPEICGDAALYASPTRPDQWLARFKALAGDPGLQQALVARGQARAQVFSWRAAALHYLTAMARVDGLEVAPLQVPTAAGRTCGAAAASECR